MGIKKIVLSFALATLVATSAVAEESGAFAGIYAGYGVAKLKFNSNYPILGVTQSGTMKPSGFRYGVILGYKQFFNHKFGVRYYGMFDNGRYKKEETINKTENKTDFDTINLNANIDALYNFISNSNLNFGTFAGASIGFVSHKSRLELGSGSSGMNIDLGINFGFRANIAKTHGVELYSHFAFLEQKNEQNYGIANFTFKTSQPYQVGLRYTFSF